MKCNKCGFDNGDTKLRFCTNCGTVFADYNAWLNNTEVINTHLVDDPDQLNSYNSVMQGQNNYQNNIQNGMSNYGQMYAQNNIQNNYQNSAQNNMPMQGQYVPQNNIQGINNANFEGAAGYPAQGLNNEYGRTEFVAPGTSDSERTEYIATAYSGAGRTEYINPGMSDTNRTEFVAPGMSGADRTEYINPGMPAAEGSSPVLPENTKKKFNILFVIIPLILILIVGGIAAFFILKPASKDDGGTTAPETVQESFEEPVQNPSEQAPTEPVADPDFNASMSIMENGELADGNFVISDEVYYSIDHSSDVGYDDAFRNYSVRNNNMLWGGYAYIGLRDGSMNQVDTSVFNGKNVFFKKYVQDVSWNPSEAIESVVPVYTFCMMGNSREFAQSTYAFMGIMYDSEEENPFYDATFKKQQQVYNNLISKYGEELANEYFANYQKVLNSSFIVTESLVATNTNSQDAGLTSYGSMYITSLDSNGDGTMSLVDVMIDSETFEMSIENPDHWITYDIDMADDFSSYDISYTDGSKIRLYRTSDKYLVGFVGSDSGAFHDIAGFGVADESYYLPNGAYSAENRDTIDVYKDFSFILMTDGTMAVDPVVTFNDDCTLTVSFDEVYNFSSKENEDRSVSFTARYSLIGCGDTTNGGFALTDDTGTYYYNYSQDSYLRSKIDDEYVDTLDLTDLYAMLTLNSRIGAELVDGFKDEGIDVTIDNNTGNVILDNGVLFDVNKSNLSADGKTYLTSVGKVFNNVITKDEYNNKIKCIRIDGYADPQGDYDHNQTLSENRAKTVQDYLASGYPEMAPLLKSEGHSSDNPVLAEDGTVDYAASRRVEIAFVIDMDEYVAEDDAKAVALYGTYIGQSYGSKLGLRSGGRGSFTNSGTTTPRDINWKIENDIVVITLPFGYDVYSEYNVNELYLYNNEQTSWSPDTFVKVDMKE